MQVLMTVTAANQRVAIQKLVPLKDAGNALQDVMYKWQVHIANFGPTRTSPVVVMTVVDDDYTLERDEELEDEFNDFVLEAAVRLHAAGQLSDAELEKVKKIFKERTQHV